LPSVHAVPFSCLPIEMNHHSGKMEESSTPPVVSDEEKRPVASPPAMSPQDSASELGSIEGIDVLKLATDDSHPAHPRNWNIWKRWGILLVLCTFQAFMYLSRQARSLTLAVQFDDVDSLSFHRILDSGTIPCDDTSYCLGAIPIYYRQWRWTALPGSSFVLILESARH